MDRSRKLGWIKRPYESVDGTPHSTFRSVNGNNCSGRRQDAAHLSEGTITGWDKRTDIRSGAKGETVTRNKKVYELKGADLVYQVDYCGAFQAGKFTAGQAVDYRVDGERLYIRRDDGKEYKCKIEGTKATEGAKTDAPSTSAPPAKT